MSKRKEITSYFQPKKKQTTTCEDEEPSAASIEVTGDGVEPLIFGGINRNSEQNPQNPEIVNEGIDSENTNEIIDFNSLIRDPGLRKHIETYHPNKKDLIRRAYIDLGPYQPVQVYPFSGPENHPHRFQKRRCGSNTFTVKGFNSWRKVNNRTYCAFRCHVGKGDGSNSAHNFAAKCYYNLKNQPCHWEKIVEKQSAEEIKRNRMRLKTSIDAICSLIRMYGATRSVLIDVAAQGTTFSQRGDALSAIKMLISYEFVFILHVVKEIMTITDLLCRALQQKSQDILNAMHLVSTTKMLIQKLRSDGWESLLVRSFCERHTILIPDMNAPYFDVLKSLRRQGKQKQMVTMEHHYRVEIFTAAIDQQLQELNNRFSEQMMELLILSASLNLRDGYRSFNIENICKLAENFYPEDFLGDQKIHLQCELQHYGLDVLVHPDLKNLSTLGDLCHGLVTTGKADMYPLVDRLLRLVLTLPTSTATSERAFSAMKIVKTSLLNRIEDEFCMDYLIVYIEKEIAETISAE
ncbi:uncharacterized protein LOC141684955 [Apium graveolens]|uniref:uncharacterized protein LOC141684955 n=1 Tax=Apium graveolens TaxID=4045 RepID=UPI003D7B23F4